MANTMARPGTRPATPARWQAALRRALEEGVSVRQLAGSGAWLATSGTDPLKAYELAVVGGVVRSCNGPAGQFGDQCCKHAARFYFLLGTLDLEADPTAPQPGPCCASCGRRGVVGQDGKPLPAVIRCPRCRNQERGGGTERPAARVPAATDLAGLAQLVAYIAFALRHPSQSVGGRSWWPPPPPIPTGASPDAGDLARLAA